LRLTTLQVSVDRMVCAPHLTVLSLSELEPPYSMTSPTMIANGASTLFLIGLSPKITEPPALPGKQTIHTHLDGLSRLMI
jgi:hypothetical protein